MIGEKDSYVTYLAKNNYLIS